MVLFVGYLCFSASQIHKIEIGLDQKLSMPDVSIDKDETKSTPQWHRNYKIHGFLTFQGTFFFLKVVASLGPRV